MNRNDWIEFECEVMDMAERENIKDVNDLEKFSRKLHESLETALLDYADDNNIEEYESQYY